MMELSQVRLAIFASGTGSNAVKIMEHFSSNSCIKVALMASNKQDCGAFAMAHSHNIPTLSFTPTALKMGEVTLLLHNIHYVILAGFLLKIPQNMLDVFPDRIINIHPSLLPKYGGKGMYGMNVHAAVKQSGDSESGITIHVVNEEYDRGEVIAQYKTQVLPADQPADIARKVQILEHTHFPQQIEQYIGRTWKC
jgi:phosphoribosylglycinamide formyltransferase-1